MLPIKFFKMVHPFQLLFAKSYIHCLQDENQTILFFRALWGMVTAHPSSLLSPENLLLSVSTLTHSIGQTHAITLDSEAFLPLFKLCLLPEVLFFIPDAVLSSCWLHLRWHHLQSAFLDPSIYVAGSLTHGILCGLVKSLTAFSLQDSQVNKPNIIQN